MADEKKTAYIRDLVRNIQELGAVFDVVADLENEFFDLGYNVGGADAIIDADVVAYDLTAANISSGITMIQQIKNFAGNVAVTTDDYALTANIFKRAPV